MNTTIKSYFGANLAPKFINNGGKTLAIVLPGIGYTLDRANLEYSTMALSKLKFDILEIEYGFQISRKSFDPSSNEFDTLCKETLLEIEPFLNSKYKKIVIIAKSIGSAVSVFLNSNIKGFKIINVLISPIDKTFNMGISKDALVFTGSEDPLLSETNKMSLKETNKNYICFKDANHSLNIENKPIQSLNIQIELVKDIISFLE